MYNNTIGIIGRGFVGSALESFFSEDKETSVISYDIKDGKNIEREYSLIAEKANIIYICLPTPNKEDGSCDTSIIENALVLLNEETKKLDKFSVVIIKSTVSPGTSRKFSDMFSHLVIVFNPEFLTERTAVEDVKSITDHLYGCPTIETSHILRVILDAFTHRYWPNSKIRYAGFEEVEMVKLISNSFFATKIIFANFIYDLCVKMNIDYANTISVAKNTDKRLGNIHWQVPGPDGKRGFGNTCLPKDTNAMIALARQHKVDPKLLSLVQNINEEDFGRIDWKIKGRSVS